MPHSRTILESPSERLGTSQNLPGTRAGTIDRGGEDFSKKIRGAKTFFTTKFENPRFRFSKKAIFEDQKVIFVGSSDSSVLIGV